MTSLPNRTHVFRVVLISTCSLSLAVSACAPLPDLSGYGAATVDVRNSVIRVGESVESEIKEAKVEKAAEQAKDFHQAWEKTTTSLGAVVEYANSLEAIASAGNKGAESAQRVAGEVEKLAVAAGVTPAPAVLGAVVDSAAFLYGELAKIRAAKSLKAAVAASGPAIAEIEALVTKQVISARAALDASVSSQLGNLKVSTSGEANARRENIEAERLRIVDLYNPGGRMSASATMPDLQKRLDQLKVMDDALAPASATYAAEKSRIDDRAAAARQLIAATLNALDAWSASHNDVVAAIRDHRPVTLESLRTAIGDVRGLLGKWEKV